MAIQFIGMIFSRMKRKNRVDDYKVEDAIGCRILDIDTNKVQDVPIKNFISVIKNGSASVIGVDVDHEELIGTNGKLDRYPKIFTDGKCVGNVNSPIIIINRLGDLGFTVCDFKGTVKKVRKSDVISYGEKFGVANGKITEYNFEKVVSSINGNYAVIDIGDSNDGIVINERTCGKDYELILSFKKYCELIGTNSKLIDKEIEYIMNNLNHNDVKVNFADNEVFLILVAFCGTFNNLVNAVGKDLALQITNFCDKKLPIPRLMSQKFYNSLSIAPSKSVSIVFNEFKPIISKVYANNSYPLLVTLRDRFKELSSGELSKSGLNEIIYCLNVCGILDKCGELMLSIDNDEQIFSRYKSQIDSMSTDDKMIISSIIYYSLGDKHSCDIIKCNIPENNKESLRLIIDNIDNLEGVINKFFSESALNTLSADNNIENSLNNKYTVKIPDGMDKVEWFKQLYTRNVVDNSEYSIIIAKDISNKKMQYNNCSVKQKYHIDKAISICEKIECTRLGITQDISDTGSGEYLLSEHKEIEDKVNKLILLADSVEMQSVLSVDSIILKICYSVLKYGKATEKQLNHINKAIEMVDRL